MTPPPRRASARYWAAYAGHEPAEALDGADRKRLITALHAHGWTDLDIAIHTRWTEYTVARIRDGIGLAANEHVALGARAQPSGA